MLSSISPSTDSNRFFVVIIIIILLTTQSTYKNAHSIDHIRSEMTSHSQANFRNNNNNKVRLAGGGGIDENESYNRMHIECNTNMQNHRRLKFLKSNLTTHHYDGCMVRV